MISTGMRSLDIPFLDGKMSMTFPIPRRPLRSHYLVCSKKHLFIVGIGPIRDKEL